MYITNGQYPVRSGKGKGPARDENLYSPYRSPGTSKAENFKAEPTRRTRSSNRPPLLPVPMGHSRQNSSPSHDMDMDEIRLTLNKLVSRLEDHIERVVQVFASDIVGQSRLLECVPACGRCVMHVTFGDRINVPSRGIDLDVIRFTLNKLVSYLKGVIEKVVQVHVYCNGVNLVHQNTP